MGAEVGDRIGFSITRFRRPVSRKGIHPDCVGARVQSWEQSSPPLAAGWIRPASYLCDPLHRYHSSSLVYMYQANDVYGTSMLVSVFVAGGATAAFYGWFPLYLPELFPTSIRATSQGFAYNFGRVLSAVGSLQTATLTAFFAHGIAKDRIEIEAFPNAARP